MDKRLIIFSLLMFCQLICCLSLSIITPFFPPYAIGKGISEDVVGLIYSANPFGAIVGSLVVGKYITQQNRLNLMIGALIVQAFGLFMFVGTNYEDEPWQIILTATIARTINGFATSTFMTPLYAYVPELYPDDQEQKIAVTEIASSLGFLIGPVVGGFIYQLGGYVAPFIFFGSLSLVLVPIVALILKLLRPGQLFKKQSLVSEAEKLHTKEGEQNEEQVIDDQPLGYIEVLKHYPIFLTALAAWAPNLMFYFTSPVYADFFETKYGVTPENVGYCFMVTSIPYILTSLVIGRIKIRRREVKSMLFGIIVMGIASFFNGPTKIITNLNPNMYISLASFAIQGSAASPAVIYAVPELNQFLIEKFPERTNQCGNMASTIFNVVVFAGELVAPFIGGSLTKWYSFEIACMNLGFILLAISILYIPIVCLHKNKQSIYQEKQ